VSGLEKAYVLLTVDIGAGKEVLTLLEEMPDVKEVYQIYGLYDFIIQVEAETRQELKDLINRIKGIGKIRSTMSMICLKDGDVRARSRRRRRLRDNEGLDVAHGGDSCSMRTITIGSHVPLLREIPVQQGDG
jgi:DNA-binding Lrp family transcriptional regulator